MTAVVVRPAGGDDARAVAEVHVASWRAAYAGLLPAPLLAGLSPDERAAAWAERLAGGAHLVLAEAAGRVVAFAAYGPDRAPASAAGEVYALYADPAAWGTGAGRAAHDAALDGLRAEHDEAVLWVLATNARGRAFYERQGWVPDGATRTEVMGGVAVAEERYRRSL